MHKNRSRKFVFRADASVSIGTGHVMRCLVLANALQRKENDFSFISRQLPGHLCDLIESKGYRVHRLPENQTLATWETDAQETVRFISQNQKAIEWLILDHYELDSCWEKKVRPFVKKILVIDDLADRPHDCDILLDQNLYENLESRYDNLVPKRTQKFLGPRYVMLRPEFQIARNRLKTKAGHVRRCLIFLGGSDPSNETAKAIEAIQILNMPDLTFDVVVGFSNQNFRQIKALCDKACNITYHPPTENIADLMSQADIAIGAGGSATWERCYLGLPTITIITAENQRLTTKALAFKGAICNIGWYQDVTAQSIADEMKKILSNPNDLKMMAQRGLQLMKDVKFSEDHEVVKTILN